MSNGQFEQQFQTSVTQTGAAYVAARDAVIAMGTAALPQLDDKSVRGEWAEKMVAEIIMGWITRRPLFEQVAGEVRAEWLAAAGLSPAGGELSATKRARVIAGLGSEVVPRLLEMLLKTSETRTITEREAVLLALDYLGDTRAVMPLVDMVTRANDDAHKVLALGTLGTLKDARAFDILESTFRDRRKDPAVRGAAVVALGQLADRRATPAILAALQDQSEERGVRRQSARALGFLRDPSAAAPLAALLRQERDTGFALTIVQSLGKLGDASAVAVLEEVGATHADDTVRRAAHGAKDSLLA